MSRGDIFAGGPALEEDVFCSTYTCSVQHRVCRTTRLLLMERKLSDLHPNPTTDEGKTVIFLLYFCSLDDHAPVDSQYSLEESSTGFSMNSSLLQL